MMRMLVAVLSMSMAADTSSTPVTFNKDVLPVLQNNCQSCHRPNQIAPMSFLTYQEVRPWAQAIKTAVLTRKMPPWFADPRSQRRGQMGRSELGRDDDWMDWRGG